jgi:hypothetical protein
MMKCIVFRAVAVLPIGVLAITLLVTTAGTLFAQELMPRNLSLTAGAPELEKDELNVSQLSKVDAHNLTSVLAKRGSPVIQPSDDEATLVKPDAEVISG